MTAISRRSFNLGLGALAGLMTLEAFDAGVARAQGGGTLDVLAPYEPPLLTHIERSGNEAISTKFLEGLLEIDLDGQFQPSLAEAWDVSADGLRYSFRLRPGVKWHDGGDLTSADVAFSILTLKETHPRRRSTFANVTGVETPDPLTAVIVLSQPAPFLLGALSAHGTPIIPRHIYEGTNIGENPANLAPIGTGPFRFVEWERGSHIIVERNPDYWDKTKPHVDQIVLHFIPDSGSRAAAFETGTVLIGTTTPVPFSEIDRLKQLPGLATEARGDSGAGNHNQIFFNLNNKEVGDLRVRQAIAHAIDAATLLQTVWYGYGALAPSAIGPKQPAFHNPNLKPFAFDPARAEALLDEAGYPRGANGKRFVLRVVHNPYSPVLRTSAEFVTAALQAVGIDARLTSTDMAAYIKTVYTDRAFDIDVQNAGNGYDPTDGVQRCYWSKNIKPGLAWSNQSHYSNPEVDTLLEAGAIETDPEKRRDLYFRFQEIIYRDLPAIGLVAFDSVTLFNTRVADHTVNHQGASGSLAAARLVS